MEIVIRTKNLEKHFDGSSILKSINLEVKKGEIVGLLGINGAGKTTLLKLLAGLLETSAGSVELFDLDPREQPDKVLKRLGMIIENPVFYDHLSAAENLRIHLEYLSTEESTNQSSIQASLDLVGLSNTGGKIVRKFSLGMKQRLGIARAIIHKPDILLLDEPINGLDPIYIKDIRKLLLNLQEAGTTIILSSHILGEILQTAERIIVIANGILEDLGSIEMLKQQHGNNTEDFLIERMRG